MAIYKHNLALDPLLPTPPPTGSCNLHLIGRDIITDTSIHSWSEFMTNALHDDRRAAFQDFVFILFNSQNRKVNNDLFPHNLLYDKVVKYFVEVDVVTKSVYGNPIEFWVPKNSSGNAIFEQVGTNGYWRVDPSLVGSKVPALKPSDSYNIIYQNITADLILGNTSVGFFQEVATMFAYFYLTRQLCILNGHGFDGTQEVIPDGGDFSSIVLTNFVQDDDYGAPINGRTNAIILEVKKPETDLPYFYNTLINSLRSLGFNIPTLSTTPSDEEKAFMSYFVKVLDPYRPLGALASDINSVIHKVQTFGNTATAIRTKRLDGGSLTVATRISNLRSNTFIEDLFVTIRSGNGGQPSHSNGAGTIFAPAFFTKPSAPAFDATNLSNFYDEILLEIEKIYNEFKCITQKAIDVENQLMMNVFIQPPSTLIDLSKTYNNTIIGTGVGETSVSMFGIQNFGLPLFNYDIDSEAVAKTKKSETKTIDISKKQILHFGVFALDLYSAPPSKLNIKLNGKTYEFEFSPFNSPTGANLLLDIPYTAKTITTSDFYNIWNGDELDYFQEFTDPTGSTQFLKVATYHKLRRDLVFRQYTPAELALYSISPIQKIEFTVSSRRQNAGLNKVTEELLTLISIFESTNPQSNLISDEVLFQNDTFQLFPPVQPSALHHINNHSYDHLLEDPSDLNTIRVIFDAMKKDYNNTNGINNRVTLNSPILLGSFVGKLSNNPSLPRVVADTNYKKKFPAGVDENGPGGSSSARSLYASLRYSNAEINIVPSSLTSPPAATEIALTIDLSIKSHVNASPSGLGALFASKLNGSACSANQALAMVRSLGLLEGIVQKMVKHLEDPTVFQVLYTGAERDYIKMQLEAWWPAFTTPLPNAAGALISCTDEMLPGAVNLATAITINEYYSFRITT